MGSNPDAAAFLGLLDHPAVLEERPVQMKIFRALGSREPELFQAAVQLCLKAPVLEEMPSIKRRFETSFVGYDPNKKASILRLAAANEEYLRDLRIMALLSSSLRAKPPLQELALSIVKKEAWLQENPAIAEALLALPDNPLKVDPKLPDLELFKETVEPLYQEIGLEEKDCISCHKNHPVLRLRPAQGSAAEERILEHYQNSLRVVDLEEPEKSLLLQKPTLPAPPAGTVIPVGSLEVHGGDVRWEKDSPAYQTVLDWIRSAHN